MSTQFNEITPRDEGKLESEVTMFARRHHRYTFSEPIDISEGNVRYKPFTENVIEAIIQNLEHTERFTVIVDCFSHGALNQTLHLTVNTLSYSQEVQDENFPYPKSEDIFECIVDKENKKHLLLGFPYLVIVPHNIEKKDIKLWNAPKVSFLLAGSNEFELEAEVTQAGSLYGYSEPYIPFEKSRKFILGTQALSGLEVLVNPYKSTGTSSEA